MVNLKIGRLNLVPMVYLVANSRVGHMMEADDRHGNEVEQYLLIRYSYLSHL